MPPTGTDANPSLDPGTYPGELVTTTCLITDTWVYPLTATYGCDASTWPVTIDGGRLTDLMDAGQLDEALQRLRSAPLIERQPVLAVGSNASPSQLRHKFTRRDTDCVVPAFAVRVDGIAVGHSAHISPAGYVPYAPFADDSQQRPLVLLWLDGPQLERVNETESNYDCATLASADYRLTLESGEVVPSYLVYRSQHGLIGGPNGDRPVAATTQAEIFSHLREQSGFANAVPEVLESVDAALTVLHESPRRRGEASQLMAHYAVADRLRLTLPSSSQARLESREHASQGE